MFLLVSRVGCVRFAQCMFLSPTGVLPEVSERGGPVAGRVARVPRVVEGAGQGSGLPGGAGH